jgi:hypothetical protein
MRSLDLHCGQIQVGCWPNAGTTQPVKRWSNALALPPLRPDPGRMLSKRRHNTGRILVKRWSDAGQTPSLDLVVSLPVRGAPGVVSPAARSPILSPAPTDATAAQPLCTAAAAADSYRTGAQLLSHIADMVTGTDRRHSCSSRTAAVHRCCAQPLCTATVHSHRTSAQPLSRIADVVAGTDPVDLGATNTVPDDDAVGLAPPTGMPPAWSSLAP